MLAQNKPYSDTGFFEYQRGLSQDDILDGSVTATTRESDTFSNLWVVSQQAEARESISIMIPEQYPSWIFNVVRKVNQLLNLSDNWDSFGAREIDVKTAVFAVETLVELFSKNLPEPSVVPTNEGGIQLEWHLRDIDFEIDYRPNNEIEVLFEDLRAEYEERDFQYVGEQDNKPADFVHHVDVSYCVDSFSTCLENR